MQHNWSQTVSRWAISPPPRMVIYTSGGLKLYWFNAEIRWTLASPMAMLVSHAYCSNSLVKSLVAVETWCIVAMPSFRLNPLY